MTLKTAKQKIPNSHFKIVQLGRRSLGLLSGPSRSATTSATLRDTSDREGAYSLHSMGKPGAQEGCQLPRSVQEAS